ncbi:nitroreductase [Sneathiella litorea]|uniref:Nitroreductase n=1 Tax=Sneathiella litorea TaxID=2606216 RepID=A0A6L8WAQ9_9PROT|nr:nitroreductase [Sneathiella litorea]MZR31744.1 nitroreductase [Sneathiella litorea]
MDVEEAIQSRRSIRAFTDQPVPKEIIDRILRLSQRAPSGTNTQPWHTYVCTGAVRDAISRDVLEMVDKGQAKRYEELDYYPAKWKDVHRDRRRGVGWGLYGLLGIEKGDRERTAKQSKRNFTFFDAPVGLFFTVDSYLLRGSWSDTGLYMQTVMLAARGEGLHTCPQAAWINYPEPIHKHLNIPDDQVLVSGMAMGYEDKTAIENTLVSEREDVANVVHYVGFD